MGHGLRSTLCVVVLQGVSEQRIHLTDRNLQQVVRWDGPDIRFFMSSWITNSVFYLPVKLLGQTVHIAGFLL